MCCLQFCSCPNDTPLCLRKAASLSRTAGPGGVARRAGRASWKFPVSFSFLIIEVQLLAVFQVHSKGTQLHTLSFSDSFPLQIII